MKIFFKIWNVFLVITTAVPAALIFMKAFGFGSLSGNMGLTSTLDVLVAGLTLAVAVSVLVMAFSGLAGKYGACSVTTVIVLILDLAAMLVTRNIVLGIVQVILLAVGIVLAEKLRKEE